MRPAPLHLSTIHLAAFRGIRETLDLDFGKRLTIIYGGNATGKSSITQAIEFAITGQVRDYEDGQLPSQYLANTRAVGPGRISLKLDDGSVLAGATDRPRSEIANRFREIGGVDWPERQPLPLTTTHVTTQGMLARVLGSANAVTRNDLSGLCAGAYLRALVSRAQKLADTFRQSSSGRNMQADIRDARANYDSAKLLYDSMVSASQLSEVSLAAIDASLATLNAKLNLPVSTPIDTTLSNLEQGIEKAEQRLRILQGLLARTRELGQYESESNELKKQIEESNNARNSLLENRAAPNSALTKIEERLKQVAGERTRLLDQIAASERHQQSMSLVSALDERLREGRVNAERKQVDVLEARQALESARTDLLAHSTKLAQLRQARHVAELQRKGIEKAVLELLALPQDRDLELEASLEVLRRNLSAQEGILETAANELASAHQKELSIAARLNEVSGAGQSFLGATASLRAFLTDGHCPLCGHDHRSRVKLEQAIEEISASVMKGSDALRQEFESAVQFRQTCERKHLENSQAIASLRGEISQLAKTIETKMDARKMAISEIDRNLKQLGVTFTLTTESLRRIQFDTEAKISGFEQELRDAAALEKEDEARLSQLERALATKSSEGAQIVRLTAELQDQIGKLRDSLQTSTSLVDLAKLKSDLTKLEPELGDLQREQGQTQASVTEHDRAISQKVTELAGAELRLQAVNGFLNSIDAELEKLGASRDPRTVLDLEQRTRLHIDELTVLKSRGLEIRQQQRTAEESRSLARAKEQLQAAERVLKSVQNRQQRLHSRSIQFKELYERLQDLQNDTAEIVLQNIRRPVGIIFQAMTAGCPWDIEFRLEEGRVNAVLTDGDASDVTATAVLNSAYVNVAAIALRLALASQQRWTRLRAVVLDDPILEMDHLTQSALIDGFEAILSSSFSPWEDLQFVLTTWSEDFAIMAAHKLAHLNQTNGHESASNGSKENFIIHRLNSDFDGRLVSQRHIPRWQSKLTIAS